MKRYAIVCAAFVIAFLAGCTAAQNVKTEYSQMPAYVRELPSHRAHVYSAEGSLWSSSEGSLYSDLRAHNVGDIVTIVVNEEVASDNTSKTQVSSSSSVTSGLAKLLGAETSIFRAVRAPASGTADGYTVPTGGSSNDLVDFGGKNSYSGQGQNQQKSTLTATITARVIKVLPDHKLFIRGEKDIYSNGEAETLVITGVIDERYISADDTIDSTMISDAKIYYNGEGIISDTTHEGWLAKLWNIIKPF